MTPTKYQKYVFGLKSGHLKIGANGAGAYTIPRSVSYRELHHPPPCHLPTRHHPPLLYPRLLSPVINHLC